MTQKNKELYDQLILDHYKKVAKSNGLASTSTMEDPYIRKSEIDFFLASIRQELSLKKRPLRIFDIGCGNAYLLQMIHEHYPECELFGLEFTPELFEQAKSRSLPKLQIVNGDAREKSDYFSNIDIVITERMVINILNFDHQKQVLENISHCLSEDGLYLMSESFKEPLEELNTARYEMCLEPIEESYQNLYLSEEHISFLQNLGFEEVEGAFPFNYLSTQFFITRVFHKSIRPEQGKVKFSRFARFFTEALPPAIGNYSPILFRALRKGSL